MRRALRVEAWFLCSFLSVLSGCGLGTAGVVAASGGSSGTGNAATVGSELAVTDGAGGRATTSPATVSFLLEDQEGDLADVEVSFDDGMGPPQAITLTTGSNPLTNIQPGSTYTVLWNFTADLGDETYHPGLEVGLEVIGGISPDPLDDVGVGNDPPVFLSVQEPTADESTGNVDIIFAVADSSADQVDIRVEFDIVDDSPDAGWQLARPAGTLATDPTPEFAIQNFETTDTDSGAGGGFVWDSVFDLTGLERDVRVRMRATDGTESGAPSETGIFRIDNNERPIAILEEVSLFLNPDESRGIPVPFRVIDQESDPVRVVLQWRHREEADFPRMNAGAGGTVDLRDLSTDEILDLLENPARAGERQELQICTEMPLDFEGRIQALPPGFDPLARARLPELASSAAGLLARRIAGRTLEILRPSVIPEPVDWPADPLERPVDVLAIEGGPTALVLDSRSGGWSLLEIDLETGSVVRAVARGRGNATAMDFEPGRGAVIVASDVAGTWRVQRVNPRTGFVDVLVSASNGSTELGSVRGIASLGRGASVITVASSIIRLGYPVDAGVVEGTDTVGSRLHRNESPPLDPPRAVALFDDLDTPWGIVADPLDVNRLYVAESGKDRVLVVDLNERRAEELTAVVSPADEMELGTVALPDPHGIALDRSGSRLLALTVGPGGTVSLRGLDLRSTVDLDQPLDGRADPFVFEITDRLPCADGGIATGARGPAAGGHAGGGGRRRAGAPDRRRARHRGRAAALRPLVPGGGRHRSLRSCARDGFAVAHPRIHGAGRRGDQP